jgi:hypothetical protein
MTYSPTQVALTNLTTTTNLSITTPGIYVLEVTASNGCTSTASITITQDIEVPSAQITNNSGTTLLNCSQPAIHLTATGGNNYSWSNGLGSSANATVTAPGTYTVTVSGSNGCTSSSSIAITQNTTASTGDTSVTACGSFTWYGTTYNSSATPTHTFPNANGCDSVVTLHLTVNPIPVLGSISGPTEVCSYVGSVTPTIYSVAAVAGVLTYNWTVPPGVTIMSGQGTNTIGVTFSNVLAATDQRITVVAFTNEGCSGPSGTMSLTLWKTLPNIPFISGPTNICSYIGNSSVTYTCDTMMNATSFLWTAPVGGTILSGQGSRAITVSYNSTFTLGSISVTSQSNCGSRAPRTLTITKAIPATPVAINGPTSACSFIGTTNTATYSIAPVANATSYLWTVPAGATILSGQGTETVEVGFVQGFVTSLIKVRSVANCGSSGDKSLSVLGASFSAPGIISGPTNACMYINNNTQATYKINKVANAPAYLWSVPSGATIVSHLAGTGSNDTAISVSFNTNFIPGTSISVRSTGCGFSAARSLTISGVNPSTPGVISGPGNACEFMVSSNAPNGNIATYTIKKASGAAEYIWTAPPNATITGHPAGLGMNDTIVEMKYNASFVSGSLTVKSSNGCGVSVNRVLNINKLNAITPGVINVAQTSVCPARVYTYALTTMPANATSLLWSVPNGATIMSGQGTIGITVSYPSVSINGQVKVQSVNNCSSSSLQSVSVQLPECTSLFTGNIPSNQKSTETKSNWGDAVNVYPNPSNSNFKISLNGIWNFDQINSLIQLNILDVQGLLIKSMLIKPDQTITLGADMKPGVYMLQIRNGTKVKTVRLVKY